MGAEEELRRSRMVANQTSANLLPRLNENLHWKSHSARHIASPRKAERTKNCASRQAVKGVRRDHWSGHCSPTKAAALHQDSEPQRRQRLLHSKMVDWCCWLKSRTIGASWHWFCSLLFNLKSLSGDARARSLHIFSKAIKSERKHLALVLHCQRISHFEWRWKEID